MIPGLLGDLNRWQRALEQRKGDESSDYEDTRLTILAQIHRVRKLLYTNEGDPNGLAHFVDRWATALSAQTEWPALHMIAENMFRVRNQLLALSTAPKEVRTVHDMVHRLWTKAVGTDDYVKDEWKDLDNALWDLYSATEWINKGFRWIADNYPQAFAAMPSDKVRFMRLAGETFERLLERKEETTMGKSIDDMTISEVNQRLAEADELRKVLANQGTAQGAKHPWVGEKVFIRTVTYHYTGRITEITADEVELLEAAWIPEDGRFNETMRTGECAEVEPYLPDQPVRIARGAIVDWTLWRHKLPSEVK